MINRNSIKFKKVKDFSTGEVLKLTLIKKEEYVDKDYDLYTVCKISNGKTIPLYNETFTKKQVNEFYNESTYYVANA